MSVSVNPNRNDISIMTGMQLPPLFQMESPSSCLVILDSKDRVSGSVSNFRCSLYRNIPRPRYIKLKRANLVKCNNVNANNNTFIITHEIGPKTTGTITLTQGIYSPSDLCNELTIKINAAFLTSGIIDSVTCLFDPNSRTFSLTSVNNSKFYIHSDSNFIVYGKFLAPFESLPSGSIATKSTNLSGISCLLYSRYLIIQSMALSQWIFSSGASSRGSMSVNMVGSIDLTKIYTTADFDVSIPFTNVLDSLPVDSMKISVMNSQRSFPGEIDIRIVDEYGLLYENSLNLGGSYPNNELGLSLFFELTF